MQLAEFESHLISESPLWFVLIPATDSEDFFSFLPKIGVRDFFFRNLIRKTIGGVREALDLEFLDFSGF